MFYKGKLQTTEGELPIELIVILLRDENTGRDL